MTSTEENRTLWGQGERKKNPSRWTIAETVDSSEKWITEDEQEVVVIQEADDISKNLVSVTEEL